MLIVCLFTFCFFFSIVLIHVHEATEMVNGILLEKYARATVIIRDTQFIGGPGTNQNYAFFSGSDSTLNVSSLITPTPTLTVVPTTTVSNEDEQTSGDGYDTEIVLIIVVISVCILMVCVFGLIKLIKNKKDQSKNNKMSGTGTTVGASRNIKYTEIAQMRQGGL